MGTPLCWHAAGRALTHCALLLLYHGVVRYWGLLGFLQGVCCKALACGRLPLAVARRCAELFYWHVLIPMLQEGWQ